MRYLRGFSEKLMEAVRSVFPIAAIVLVLSVTLLRGEISGYTLTSFMLGAVMLVVGSAFFTLGADISMMPMGKTSK